VWTPLYNKPGIIHRDRKEICFLTDVYTLSDKYVLKKKAEKMLKYTDLLIEVQRMCNVKVEVTSIIICETGSLSRSFQKYSEGINKQSNPEFHVHSGNTTKVEEYTNVAINLKYISKN
jgi:hypothetical protein